MCGPPFSLAIALLRAYLHTLLSCCLRVRQQPSRAGGSPPPSLLLRFRQLLEQRYTVRKSVADYAAHLRVTFNHLGTAVRKKTGQHAHPAAHYAGGPATSSQARCAAQRSSLPAWL